MAAEGGNGALSGKPDRPAVAGPDSGWEGISELLSGFRTDQVPFLAEARELEPAYPLLHALAHGSLREFIIRVAALEALIADGRTPFTPAEVTESLYWLKDPVRESVLAALRRSGWLSFRPDSGYRITDAGRFVATVLSFLRARVREGSVLPAVEGIDYMLNLGVGPSSKTSARRWRTRGTPIPRSSCTAPPRVFAKPSSGRSGSGPSWPGSPSTWQTRAGRPMTSTTC